MVDYNERMHVLEMIESGLITAEEGARLLQALESLPAETFVDPRDAESIPPVEVPPPAGISGSVESAGDAEPLLAGSPRPAADEAAASGAGARLEGEMPSSSFEAEAGEPAWRAAGLGETTGGSEPFDASMIYWRRWWMIPMWIGVGITVIGGLFMYLALRASGIGFWFGCAWLPFLLGLAVMALAWGSRTARWLHLRVQQKPGERPQKIAISFPLPLRLTAWFLRVFGHRIPGLQNTSVDEIIMALGETTSPETPFYLEVDEGEDGEKVQIYIG
jgi:hypothetical protein